MVIEKPSGITSVPYERKETGTALDLIRAHWRRAGKRATATPLYTVHRIDKDTSGLLCFAKTRLAERALHEVFQRHTAAPRVPGRRRRATSASRAHRIARWSPIAATASAARPRHAGPRPARRHARRPPCAACGGATLCRVRLETGRTHQIRIHLSERGHPLVGETVYIRDLLRAGREPLPSPRLMLHAATLGFPHPVTGEPLDLRAEPPRRLHRRARIAGRLAWRRRL